MEVSCDVNYILKLFIIQKRELYTDRNIESKHFLCKFSVAMQTCLMCINRFLIMFSLNSFSLVYLYDETFSEFKSIFAFIATVSFPYYYNLHIPEKNTHLSSSLFQFFGCEIYHSISAAPFVKHTSFLYSYITFNYQKSRVSLALYLCFTYSFIRYF